MYENAYDWSSGGKVWTLQIMCILWSNWRQVTCPCTMQPHLVMVQRSCICIVFFILFSTSRFIYSPIWALKVSFNIEALTHKMKAWNSSYWNIVHKLEFMKPKAFPNTRIWVSMSRFLLWNVKFFKIDNSIIMHFINNHLHKIKNTT